jgi:glycosidase
MPDFNFRNPKVLDFHLNNLKFWLNRGVDGFRIDAAGVLVENNRLEWENQAENHQVLHQFRALLDRYDNRYMVVEAPSAPAEFAAQDSAGSAFAFGLQRQIVASANLGRALPGLLEYLSRYPVADMGTFLANHDSFAGIRLYSAFGGDEARYKQAATTLLALPGIPFIYYGEEIGQSGSDPVKYADQRQRGPMSWDASANAGFTKAGMPFRPNAGNAATHNVANEESESDSLLNTYRALIHLRSSHLALSAGTLEMLSEKDQPLFAFVRETTGEKLLVLINYSDKAQQWVLPKALMERSWRPIYPVPAAPDAKAIDKMVSLAPFESEVFELEGP